MKIDMKNNKISVMLFLVSSVLQIIAYNTKYPKSWLRERLFEYGTDALAMSDYRVVLFWITLPYDTVFTILILLIALSIFLIIYKDDDEIREMFTKLRERIHFSFIKSATFFKNRSRNLIKIITNKGSSILKSIKKSDKKKEIGNQVVIKPSNKRYHSALLFFLKFSCLYVLIMSFISSKILLFSIFLSFYLFLTLNPKTKKEVIRKAFLTPLIMVIGFALISNHPYYNFIQKISYNLVFYIISALLIYFALSDKLKNNREFSFKHPLFWVSLIYLVHEIFNEIIKSRIEEVLF